MQEYILGIDIGTGSAKCVSMGLDGEVIHSLSGHYETYHPISGYSEQDPDEIWNAVVTCIKNTITQLGKAPKMVALSSAMHSFIILDSESSVLYPMITWADNRSESIAAEYRGHIRGQRLYRNTGTPIHAMSPFFKALWFRQNEPELFRKAAKFISIKDYVWFRLFGEFESDYSIASASGLFNIHELSWDNDALSIAGLNSSHLPKVVDTSFTRKVDDISIEELTGLPKGTPILIGASDGCCANLGSGVLYPYQAALTIGTSGAVRVSSNKPILNNDTMIFNYRLDKQTLICGGAVNNGGNTLNWLMTMFMQEDNLDNLSYKKMFQQIAQITAGADDLLFIPYIHGERSPIWNANATGSFLNIGNQHRQAHFLRAGLEGICFALNDVLQTIEAGSVTIRELHISGGFTNSPVWTQILADITGKKLYIMQTEDASAIGAAYLAMRAVYPEYYHRLLPLKHRHLIEPNQNNHQIYREGFRRFKAASALLQTI